MEHLASYGLFATTAAMVAFYAFAMLQMLHVVALAYRRNVDFLRGTLVYEVGVGIHLSLNAVIMYAAMVGWYPLAMGVGLAIVPVINLLWLNVFVCIGGVVLYAFTRRVSLLGELVIVALLTPPCIIAFNDVMPVFLLLDLVFFGFLVILNLSVDVQHLRNSVSRLAAIEAINLLPEGVACADSQGRMLLINDTMRLCLARLGFPADLADMSVLRAEIKACASAQRSVDDELPSPSFADGLRIVIRVSADRTSFNLHAEPKETDTQEEQAWLFVADEFDMDRQRCQRLIAYDLSEEYRVEQQNARANAELEAVGLGLNATLENVKEVARNEALLRIRSRVHDVIGQRLSLLHRCLEDGDITDEQLAVMSPLLANILDDLAEDAVIDQQVELDAIVSAFALVGVTITVKGNLPQNLRAADAAVHIVREAATNAVKHAQATHIMVEFDRQQNFIRQVVRDNGIAFAGSLVEGTGLKGMRHAVSQAGGTFIVQGDSPFTLEATFPEVDDKEMTASREGDMACK